MSDEQKQFLANMCGAILAVALCAASFTQQSCSQRPLEDRNAAPTSSTEKNDAVTVGFLWQLSKQGRFYTEIAPTGSMAPFIDSGCIALWEKIDGADKNLRVGQVVIFDRGDIPNVAHRIVELNKNAFIAAGDNVRGDGWIQRSKISARLCGVIYTNKKL